MWISPGPINMHALNVSELQVLKRKSLLENNFRFPRNLYGSRRVWEPALSAPTIHGVARQSGAPIRWA
jgi:hypothetical protein